jgi:hypothetical protein
MKIKTLSAAVLIAALFASCESETQKPGIRPGTPSGPDTVPETITMTFSADLSGALEAIPEEVEARAALGSDGMTVTWEATDHIAVYDGVAIRDFGIKSTDGAVAVFEGEVDKDATEFYAVYPYSAAGESLPSEGLVSIKYPAVQTVGTSAVSADALVCVAKADANGTLAFKNVGALLKIHVEGDDVTSVTMKGKNDEFVAGNADASMDGVTTESDATSVTLKPSGEFFAEGDYYIGMLPVEFTEGFTVVYQKDAAKAFVSTDTPVDFPRNGGYDITASTSSLSWIPQTITTESQLRAFASASAFYGKEEVITIGNDISLEGAWTPFELYCTLDGNSKKISGLDVDADALAGFVSVLHKGAVLKNAEIEGSITLTGTGSLTYAGLVAHAKGSVEGVTNRASVTMGETATCPVYAGGLVGYLSDGGSIDKSFNYGAVSLLGASSGTTFVGGVVGYMKEGCGNVTETDNHGDVSCANSKCEGAGGIVGMMRGAKVEACDNKAAAVTIASGKTGGWGCYQAGIVAFAQNYTEGDLVITGCTNDAEVSTSAQIWGVAGICGIVHNVGDNYKITDNTNNGNVTFDKKAATNQVFCGGILAIAEAPVEVTGNINEGNVKSISGRTSDATGVAGGIVGTVFRNSSRTGSANRTTVISENYNFGEVALEAGKDGAKGVAAGVVGNFNISYGSDTDLNTVTLSKNRSLGAIISPAESAGAIFATCSSAKALTITAHGNRIGCLLNDVAATAANVFASCGDATCTPTGTQTITEADARAELTGN